MASPQIAGILVFPRVGCPALPGSKTYHLSKSRILGFSKRSSPYLFGIRTPTFILGSNWDPGNGHWRPGKREEVLIFL